VLGLVGRADGSRFDKAAVHDRLSGTGPPGSAAASGIDSELALLGSFVAGPRALAAFAGDARANTDDMPVVAYRAPHITYAPDSRPGDRLSALLHELSLDPAELMTADTDAAWLRRLASYAVARNRFIEAGRGVTPSRDVRVMLAQVRGPLLEVLRASPDFRPAYDPLLRMATTLRSTDSHAATVLLDELAQTQVARP
jgi:spermidine synthase